MIDHTGLIVSNLAKSKDWYRMALAPIGFGLLMEFPAEVTGTVAVAGFGIAPMADFWLSQGTPNRPGTHIAFRADSRSQVDAFYAAALQAGGLDNGAPGLRPHYHQDYYAAFVIDLDGHNIEVVCRQPQ
ncbi:MAG: VOC family protein [Alphaproteobacteria bacterium]|nr:VOC family protein [Alphaproteobacteria bacterium]